MCHQVFQFCSKGIIPWLFCFFHNWSFCLHFFERLPNECNDAGPFLISSTEKTPILGLVIWLDWCHLTFMNINFQCLASRSPFWIIVIWLDQPHLTFMNINIQCLHHSHGALSELAATFTWIIGYVFHGCMVKSQLLLN